MLQHGILVPSPGIDPWPLHCQQGILARGPSGKLAQENNKSDDSGDSG